MKPESSSPEVSVPLAGHLPTFESLVLDLQILTREQLHQLKQSAAEQQVPLHQLALRTGLLNPNQSSIVETLLHPNDSLPGYEILSLLGRGGMGVVYRARQKSLNRIVALKTVLVSELPDPAALRRFEQEAVALARLTHPHIVAVYDFGKHHSRLFLAMELVSGEDCERFVRRHGPPEPYIVWGIIRQAAAGLAHAAAAGIVHRDIKPANLLLLETPVGFPLPPGVPLVKIADFGLAQLMGDGDQDSRTRLTQQNATIGSPHYMAPEQLDGSPADPRTDIYALGITAWHLLAGVPPLSGKPLSQIFATKLTGELPSIRSMRDSVPQESAELIAAMVRRRPADRISEYGELIQRIDQLALVPNPSSVTLEVEHADQNIHTADTVLLSQLKVDSISDIPAKPTVAVRARRRQVIKRLFYAAVLILGASAAIGLRLRSEFVSADLVPAGSPLYIFNGKNLSQWQTISGEWYSGIDDEGAPVLVGERGVLARKRPASADPCYRLELAVRLLNGEAAELHFGFAEPGSSAPRKVLRLTREGAQLGTRQADDRLFRRKSKLWPNQGEAHAMRHVRLERHTRGWLVWVNGQFMGAQRERSAKVAPEFRLRVENGPIWFSDIVLDDMVRRQRQR